MQNVKQLINKYMIRYIQLLFTGDSIACHHGNIVNVLHHR